MGLNKNNRILKFFWDICSNPNKVVYEKHVIGNDGLYSSTRNAQINEYKRELKQLNPNIKTHKIRFVFNPNFSYDIDKDVINPKYEVLFPVDKKSGDYLFNENLIEVNKPKNLVISLVKKYEYDDILDFLSTLTKKTKRGVVIYVNNAVIINNNIIYLSILDEVINEYKLNN